MTDKPTSAKPITAYGQTWRCFRTGIQRFEWRADDAPLTVRRNFEKMTFSAYWDGVLVGNKFRSQDGAMLAAVNARAARPTP